ncbi:Acyl-CoA-binding domain-containing protein 5 [Acropora cervicornis]|uniref:Acyl-CoA-binding domain-containing protein 5 n=1 Tax=Acropora cervicornis TaxID=6130 RepID=A0AAD9QYT5_ACRCE|nr:Acyl-CoA-binding domain-containing protein 5 [Acropora cervicornis]
MAGSVEDRFHAAVNVVRSMPKKGAYQPSNDTMLKFYALYKQANEGACHESKPGFWDIVMESLPSEDGAEELFTDVLKSFYKEVYQGQDEPLPTVLKAFKDETPQNCKIKEFNLNGHNTQVKSELDKVPFQNGVVELPDQNGSEKDFPLSTDCGFPHRDSLHLAKIPQKYKKNGMGPFSKGVNSFLIISPDDLIKGSSKEKVEEEEDDNDEHQDRTSEVPPLKPHNTSMPNAQNSVVLTSDDSEDDEFCDTVDPEHLQEPQNGDQLKENELYLDDTLQVEDHLASSTSSSSPEHATNSTLTESENSDLENDILKSSELLTSTPFAKHVTFAVESNGSADSSPVVNSELSKVTPSDIEESFVEVTPLLEGECISDAVAVLDASENNLVTPIENGDQKRTGILKSHHPVRECGGGEASQQPPGRGCVSRTRHTQGLRNKGGGDSDSEDEFTSDHTSGPDYDSAGDELNDRVLIALERLHQDMKNVLRRLSSIEESISQSQLEVSRQSNQPWWKTFVPSKPLVFLILWPFIVNLVFYHLKQRKSSQKR